MELYIDTANLDSINRVQENYPIDGVTTNPTNLAREERRDWDVLLKEIRQLIPGKKLFIQLPALNNALDQANRFKALVGDPLVIKVPMIEGSVRTIRDLVKAGFSICATAVYTPLQAYMASRAGADYIAPYISHISNKKNNDNTSPYGSEIAVQMQKTLQNSGFSSKVLGASFRTLEQLEKVWLEPDHIEAVTVTEEFMKKLEQNDGTDSEMARFNASWNSIN